MKNEIVHRITNEFGAMNKTKRLLEDQMMLDPHIIACQHISMFVTLYLNGRKIIDRLVALDVNDCRLQRVVNILFCLFFYFYSILFLNLM